MLALLLSAVLGLSGAAGAGHFAVLGLEGERVDPETRGLLADEGTFDACTGQNIGADCGITGLVAILDGSRIVTLKLFDSDKGSLLGTERTQAGTLGSID